MASDSERPIRIELTVNPGQSELLAGLDAWLALGLISDDRVKQISQAQLSCLLPQAVSESGSSAATEANQAVGVPDFADAAVAELSQRPSDSSVLQRQAETSAAVSSRLTRLVQSLMAEISITWLLFLGVFLVVVSSGVLAASQWQNVSAAGQYGILLAYTLAFWGTSLWVGSRSSLRLTSRMLQVTTLLIIPINFWMIDGLTLWGSLSGWGIAAIAAISLTAITIGLMRRFGESFQPDVVRLMTANAIALSWLHWGWDWSMVPLVATYAGTVGTALLVIRSQRLEQQVIQPAERQTEWQESASYAPESARYSKESKPPAAVAALPLSTAFLPIAFATLLLIARALLDAQIPMAQLGSAFGICGWLLCWLTRQLGNRGGWVLAGSGLLILGWGVSVFADPPWQAIAVTSLGLWLLGDRVQRRWQSLDLGIVFLVGLQLLWLLWRAMPPTGREAIIDTSIQLFGAAFMPVALLGIGVFPYVAAMLIVAKRLRQLQKADLADEAERMALLLGGLLTLVSLGNPAVRSLNLSLSALALGILLYRRAQAGRLLIYLTHLTALLAGFSWLDVGVPSLTASEWARLFVLVALTEWSLSSGDRYLRLRRSTWHLGLGLAAVSYALLLLAPASGWNAFWLLIPAMLTGLAHYPRFSYPQQAIWLSTLSLLAVQVITFGDQSSRLAGLGIAAMLMGFNSRLFTWKLVAGLTVAFGLGFIAAGLWKVSNGNLPPEWILNLLAIAPMGLWLIWSGLQPRSASLARAYAWATDIWAALLSFACLLSLTLYDGLFPQAVPPPRTLLQLGAPTTWQFTLAAAALTGAIALRLSQRVNHWVLWGLAWSFDLTVLALVAAVVDSRILVIHLAIAHLALGLVVQLVGDWWLLRLRSGRASLHAIPLAYASIGFVLSQQELAAWTGLYAIAAALVCIGVGRRQTALRGFTFIGLALVSLGAYELLIYRLLQARGGAIGDGIVALAALAAVIALGDRLGGRWIRGYLHLSRSSMNWVAHVHWGLGSAIVLITFLLTALSLPLSPTGKLLGLVIALGLTAYALSHGNRYAWGATKVNASSDLTAVVVSALNVWTYIGILQLTLTLVYGLYQIAPTPLVLARWGGAIATGFGLLGYGLPWSHWGWPLSPWRRTAIALPVGVTLCSSGAIALQTLLIAAAFYAWIAVKTGATRISYLSVILADWAILRILVEQSWIEPLWISIVCGGSLLYLAQVDPHLRSPSEREKRHVLRVLATSLMCFTGLYQAEVSLWAGPLLLGLTLGLLLLGLAIQVRAFLYVGTATFVVEILRQVWRFVYDNPLLIWAIGIAVGLVLIWVAATFEARRNQVSSLFDTWITKLDDWE